jgi:endonuclease YncB( thermonuclease family)
MHRTLDRVTAIALIAITVAIVPPATAQTQTTPQQERSERTPQSRAHGKRIAVDPAKVRVSDGDTVELDWGAEGRETVRIIGIDTPEIAHPDHDLPYAQSFGYEAQAFAMGAFAAATKVEVLRTDILDTYGRTLGYMYVNDMNYSVLVVKARLAEESVSRYGDNGLPEQAAEVMAAAKAAGPMPFEPPGLFRRRMRDVSRWMQEQRGAPRD